MHVPPSRSARDALFPRFISSLTRGLPSVTVLENIFASECDLRNKERQAPFPRDEESHISILNAILSEK